jgi:tetratricopeptide (TPR) repeat protein
MPRRPFKLGARQARFAGAAKGETFAESGFKQELRGSDERTVATRASDTALEPRMQRLLERLSANPADMAAFATLEEHLFLAGDWGRLAGIYECRISALQPGDRELPELLLRLARLLDERLGDPVPARRRYEELLRIQPRHPAALAGLRSLLARLNEPIAALQIAEIEEQLPLGPSDRARVLAATGEIWQRMGDENEAARRFEQAVELDPACDAGLAGLAALAQNAGRTDEAIRYCERRLERLAGPRRAAALEQLAALLPEDQGDRVRSLLRETVHLAPERRAALDRLIELESERGAWHRVDELHRTLWGSLASPESRLELALDAAATQFERAKSLEATLFWAERLHEVGVDDLPAQRLLARIFRRARQAQALIGALERIAALEGPSPELAFELASLYQREGQLDKAVEHLQGLFEEQLAQPEDLTLLDRCLEQLGRHAERIEVLEALAASASGQERLDRLVQIADLCASALGDPERAEAAYRRVAAEEPEEPRATAGLEELLRQTERMDDLDRLLEERAQNAPSAEVAAESWCALADLRLESQEDADGARGACLRALDCAPAHLPAIERLRRIADAAESAEWRLEALELELGSDPAQPRRSELLREMVDVHGQLEDPSGALRAAERWAELSPNPEALGRVADLSRSLGERTREQHALQALEALLDGDPVGRAVTLVRLAELTLERAEPESLERAAALFRESLALDPDPAVRRQLLDVCRNIGDLAGLVAELERAVEEAPAEEQIALRLELARALIECEDRDGATDALLPAFEQDPTRAEVRELLESLLADQDRLEELERLLERLLRREPDAARRRALAQRRAELLLDSFGRPAEAAAVLREVADPSQDRRIEDIFQRALEVSGERRELEGWLRAREPHLEGEERLELLMRLGSLQKSLGKTAECLESLRRAERIAPPEQREGVRAALLSTLRAHGGPEEQLELLEAVIAASDDPAGRASLRVERARLLAGSADRPDEAIDELEQARGEAPLQMEGLRLLAELYRQRGWSDGQPQVLEALVEASELPDERFSVLLELGKLRAGGPERVRDSVAAERALLQALELDPQRTEPFDQLAELYAEEGRTQELERLLQRRLADTSPAPGAQVSLALRVAELQARTGRRGEAIATLESARPEGATNAALEERFFSYLEAERDPRCIEICREQAEGSTGSDRRRWLVRWLRSLERADAPAAEQLEVVDTLLAEGVEDLEILAARVRLLRQLHRLEPLAEALEATISSLGPSGARRRILTRELLGLLEGPLRDPARALELIELEIEEDPALRVRGARLAESLDDPARLVRLLSPVVLEAPAARPAAPEDVRRLALALHRTGEGSRAEPLLWSLVEARPRDREVLHALEAVLRQRGDAAGLLRVLDWTFAVEGGERRIDIAMEGFKLAQEIGDERSALGWARCWNALGELPPAVNRVWADLERRIGDRGACLEALQGLRAHVTDPEERARLLATEAAVHAERGHHELARAAYQAAIEEAERPEAQWLEALDGILAALSRPLERLDVLRALSEHPDLEPSLQARRLDERVELLATQPTMRAQAAAELRESIESSQGQQLDRALVVQRIQRLLSLYESLEDHSGWCDLAEKLLPLLPLEERTKLERHIARWLTGPLFARERALARWESVLDAAPDDAEALEALSELLRAPGMEGRLCEVLERRSQGGGPAEPDLRVEAARLRAEILGDGQAALRHLNRALELEPERREAHELRIWVCGQLGRSDDEAASLQALLAGDPSGDRAARRWARLSEILADHVGGADEAVEAADKALALAGGDAEVRSTVRRVFELCGASERAAELLREEVALVEPEQSAPLLRRLAHIHGVELSDPRGVCEAMEALVCVAELAPGDEQLWADALGELGDWPEAITHRLRGLEMLGDDASGQSWTELARQMLSHLDDAAQAREACDRALELEPDSTAALALRAQLHAARGDREGEVADRQRLGELLTDGPEAAAALAEAARIAHDELGDPSRAWSLYRLALSKDATNVQALVGAGSLAIERGEWGEAERMLGLACTLMTQNDLTEALPQAARRAARAASALQRHAEAFDYLELALREDPHDPETLDEMAALAERLGALDQARQALEARLAIGGLDAEQRCERLRRLASICESQGDLPTALDALADVITLRPSDFPAREAAVDLLERLDQSDRAIEQVEDWIRHAEGAEKLGLEFRAARLELRAGRRAKARSRLEALAELEGAPQDVWPELAELVLEDDGASAALEFAARALEKIESGPQRGRLLWLTVQADLRIGNVDEAVRSACETLELQPDNLEAALLLARHLGKLGDWDRAVASLERALEVAKPCAAREAELYEAIGRAYAGPLENIEAAERALRRALERNPSRDSAREALADITSFHPRGHAESLRLHRDLLQAFPARAGSWRAISRVGQQAACDAVTKTCAAVLAALGAGGVDVRGAAVVPLVLTDASGDATVRAATKLLRALRDAGALPPAGERDDGAHLPGPIATQLDSLSGSAWGIANEGLKALWSEPAEADSTSVLSLPWRLQRRLQRTLRDADPEALRSLDPEVWRVDLLAQAAAAAVRQGRVSLRDALVALVAACPESAHLDLSHGGDLAAATQLSPAARALLLRIVDATYAELSP